jgi:hypothetical protein
MYFFMILVERFKAHVLLLWAVSYTDTDTDISQHTPYQGFSVTGYIMNR